ncbi:hypothetical protein CEK28_04420 [Xenophilus sp. AP218F]|nr:hypothetical protein [Chromobacterium sp. ASV5]OWY39989.1 hypothetical protein CEK28_04420 [Xenophilus sp. AP218F]
MNSKIFSCLVVCAVALLAGCTSFKATILPQQNHTYSAIAMASSQKAALEDAVGKATEVCKEQKKQLVILNREEESKSDGDSTATQMTKMVVGTLFSIRNDEDHKITLLFRCE